MWTSTQTTDGDIGVSGANSICQTEAAGAGLDSSFSYTHRAVIISSSSDPKTISGIASRAVQRPDGTVITNSYTDFFDETVTTTNSITTNTVDYWTGFLNDGTLSTFACTNWTSASNSVRGRHGRGDRTDVERINYDLVNCDLLRNILCISY